LKTEHVENLSSRVGCRIENWVTTTEYRRPPGEYNTPPDTTRQLSCVGVGGGVYWARA